MEPPASQTAARGQWVFFAKAPPKQSIDFYSVRKTIKKKFKIIKTQNCKFLYNSNIKNFCSFFLNSKKAVKKEIFFYCFEAEVGLVLLSFILGSSSTLLI